MNKSCDILVLGAGGAGLTAGVRAADVSGKKVIILEKANFIGGGMLFASTMRTFRSRWQKERNIPDQTVDFIRKMMDLTLWRLDPDVVRNAVLGTGQFFDWYEEMETPENMAKFEPRPYIFDIPVNGQVGPQVDVFHKGSGEMFMKALQKKAGELGVEILTNTETTDVAVENGKITGVTAIRREKDSEDKLQISCDKLILASGSWIKDEAIMKKILPEFLTARIQPNAHQNKAYTGDAIKIGEKVGAFIDWDTFCLRLMGPMAATGENSKFDGLTHCTEPILVNKLGKRFVAEPMVPRMDPFDTGHVLIEQPEAKTWYIFSKDILEHMIKASAEKKKTEGPDPFGMDALPSYEVIHQWFEEAVKKHPGDFAIADTPAELAQKAGFDQAGFVHTIDSYNASCDKGEDMDCWKESQFLVPLKEGPYYAMEGILSTDGAFGGIRVNANMQAYAADGKHLIDGLYVAGDAASGRHIVMGGVKKQVLNDMSWALSSGFIAGSSAAV